MSRYHGITDFGYTNAPMELLPIRNTMDNKHSVAFAPNSSRKMRVPVRYPFETTSMPIITFCLLDNMQ